MPGASEADLRAEVRRLRDENSTARVRGARADDLARALVTAYAETTGRLADPSDLPYSDDLLNGDGLPSRDAVNDAINALLTTKPHLATRRPSGVIEQGATEEPTAASLAAILRANA